MPLPAKYILVFAVLSVIACAIAEPEPQDAETSGVPDCTECESQVEELYAELRMWRELAENCVEGKQKVK